MCVCVLCGCVCMSFVVNTGTSASLLLVSFFDFYVLLVLLFLLIVRVLLSKRSLAMLLHAYEEVFALDDHFLARLVGFRWSPCRPSESPRESFQQQDLVCDPVYQQLKT